MEVANSILKINENVLYLINFDGVRYKYEVFLKSGEMMSQDQILDSQLARMYLENPHLKSISPSNPGYVPESKLNLKFGDVDARPCSKKSESGLTKIVKKIANDDDNLDEYSESVISCIQNKGMELHGKELLRFIEKIPEDRMFTLGPLLDEKLNRMSEDEEPGEDIITLTKGVIKAAEMELTQFNVQRLKHHHKLFAKLPRSYKLIVEKLE